MNNDDKAEYNRLVEKLCAILIMHAGNKMSKKTLFYDGIYYSVIMARNSYRNLFNILCELADFLSKEPNKLAQIAITEAWAVVDHLYRLRKLLDDTPELNKKSPKLQVFYRKTKDLKPLRDSIQHLDEHILEYVQKNISAWGRLHWVCPSSQKSYKACMIISGDFNVGWNLMPSHMGEKIRTPIDFISLTTDTTVCLTHMIDALDQLVPWLNDQLNGYFDRKHQLIILCFGINTNYNIC
jgi:hypothetical protein